MSDWQYLPLAEPFDQASIEAPPSTLPPPVWRRPWTPPSGCVGPLLLDAPVTGVIPDPVRRPVWPLPDPRARRDLTIPVVAVPDLVTVGVDVPVRRVPFRQEQWLRLDPFPRAAVAPPTDAGQPGLDYVPKRRPFRVGQFLAFSPSPISTPAYLSSFWNAQSVDFARSRRFSVTLQPVGGQWPLMPLLVPLLGLWAPQPPMPVRMRVRVPPTVPTFTILPTILSAGLGNISLRKPALRLATIAEGLCTGATIAKPRLTVAPLLNGLVR